jgi:positive regulator of sigma E activity
LSSSIEHIGVVHEVNDSFLRVKIESRSACSSCNAKSLCNISEMEEKFIDVKNNAIEYKIGEMVNVTLAESLGFKALFYGYIFPFVIMFLTLIISVNITNNEAMSAIASVIVLVPYYLSLYIFREKIKKQFTFIIKKV